MSANGGRPTARCSGGRRGVVAAEAPPQQTQQTEPQQRAAAATSGATVTEAASCAHERRPIFSRLHVESDTNATHRSPMP